MKYTDARATEDYYGKVTGKRETPGLGERWLCVKYCGQEKDHREDEDLERS